ncbi:type II secretion system F family protein [Tsuneonella sp. YG55]|uniref:Type II secretion system F family protein n=1 Tax=Tsuneonella litorea TaxID=2976475 RepID=A0A9X2W275_9SPHN|nr:type II secretion system F family protein [Tsuneonella litorea]MCT2559387.1 type II secretion system F family protein [Tsuneonella litorea]
MLDTALRLGILLAIFASVFVLSQVVLGAAWRNRSRFAAVNRRLELIKSGSDRAAIAAQLRKNAPSEFAQYPSVIARPLRSLQSALFASAVSFTLGQMLFWMGFAFVLVSVGLLLLMSLSGIVVTAGVVILAVALAASISAGLPIVIINIFAQRRRKKMEQQFPVALDIFVRALRSGHPVAGAINLLTNEMEDPIGSEFGIVGDEIAYGAELTDSLEAMADRWDMEDIRMFVVSLAVQAETGGNLAEILENLSGVIRARASLFMKVRALSSEGRMTGWILTVLPIITFVSMFAINPRFYTDVSRDSIFIIGFPSLIIWYFIGVFWIRKLVDIKV